MKRLALDFETYYDKSYSLSRMTTEEYLTDERFRIIGVALKGDAVPSGYPSPCWVEGDEVETVLRQVDWDSTAVICHNAQFDVTILGWKFGLVPAFVFDTMLMAKPLVGGAQSVSLAALAKRFGLGAKLDTIHQMEGLTIEEMKRKGVDVERYAVKDVELADALAKLLIPRTPHNELLVIDQTVRMFAFPKLMVSREELDALAREEDERVANLLAPIGGEKALAVLNSADKLAALLKLLGVTPPRKISPTTGQSTWAFAKTDPEFTALLSHPDRRVRAVVKARLETRSSLVRTRTQRLLGIAERHGGRLPVPLIYWGAHTGRFSGSGAVNLQNLPRGSRLRNAIVAPEGCTLVVGDSSQIEARITAWLAGQDDLVEAFREGRDIYCEFASEIFDRPVTKEDKLERFLGKTAILGLGYGMGAERYRATVKIQSGIELPEEEAKRIVDTYRRHYPHIAELWRSADRALRNMACQIPCRIGPLEVDQMAVTLPNGYKLHYPGLRETDNGFEYDRWKDRRLTPVYIYGPKLVENIVQALAALFIREVMAHLVRKGYDIALQVHDEIVCVVPERQVDKALADLTECLSTPPDWALDLPVACEVSAAKRYGDAK